MIVEDIAHDEGREAKRGFVQHEKLRAAHEGAPHGEHLALAAREGAGELPSPLAQAREEREHLLERRRDRRARPSARRRKAPSRRLSSTLMLEKSSRFSGTRPSPAATRASTGRPSSEAPAKPIWPREGRMPMMALSSVDLPAPLAPITVAMRPASTESDTPRTASTPP